MLSNSLFKILRNAVNGVSIAELIEKYPELSRRTVQRWLSEWVAEGKVIVTGQGRARRYFSAKLVKTPNNRDKATTKTKDVFPSYIRLSFESQEILAYINQPLSARKPVGYQRDFLDAYRPNETEYLSQELREQLREMGQTPQARLPAGTYGRAILNRLLIDLSWASSHLEGNTYSRLDTQELIEHDKVAYGKDALETQMILNHKAAIKLLIENIEEVGFNRFTILNLHSALSENLLPNSADEGRIRNHAVEIGKSVYRPLAFFAQINEAFDLILEKADQINDPFEQSFFMMVHLPYLQAFVDVNKRTSRLAANISLIRANLCPMTFIDVPEQAYSRAILGVYELTRIELLRDLYIWAYERSTQEYLAVKQELVQPNPLRLAYRNVIRETLNEVVNKVDQNPFDIIENSVLNNVSSMDRENVKALIIEELQRLHEGVLARYDLRPVEFEKWVVRQDEGWRSFSYDHKK